MPKQDGKGRAAAIEILLNTPLIADMIFKGEVGEMKEIMKKSRELGMQTFDQALFDAFEANLISYEDALRNADSINDLRLQIKLNSQGHIITIEDPVEFVHPHKNCVVTQREVGLDTDDWEAALKNTLRQAPDVILMGEIRDRETMEHAVAFAETGHLCLATLHANSANQALDRIINFFPEERRQQLLMDLSLNLRSLISQRLIPKQDSKGRTAVVEILLNSPLISDLIFKGEVGEIKEIMKKSRELGMQTFDQALFDAFEANLISYDDALRNADSANDLRLQIKLTSKRAKSLDLAAGTEHLQIV